MDPRPLHGPRRPHCGAWPRPFGGQLARTPHNAHARPLVRRSAITNFGHLRDPAPGGRAARPVHHAAVNQPGRALAPHLWAGRPARRTGEHPMKNLMMALVAIVGTSFAFPAFAEDAPKMEGGEKKEKKAKKGHKGEKKEDGKMGEGKKEEGKM
jgi:hypothetical protein